MTQHLEIDLSTLRKSRMLEGYLKRLSKPKRIVQIKYLYVFGLLKTRERIYWDKMFNCRPMKRKRTSEREIKKRLREYEPRKM